MSVLTYLRASLSFYLEILRVLIILPGYLGTSSNWAFNRRVLSMAHERLTGQPVPVQNTMFDGTMYDLGWNGQRDVLAPDTTPLPSADYAIYLINAVKFHCGQMFHLFDEVSFMRRFHEFHATPKNTPKLKDLWYVHFLLILAFGKVFVAHRNDARRPPGADLFVQAMKLKPDITFLHTQPVQSIEILCCEALYLQCLDFRSAAYSVIGQALRIALEEGMHTNMQDQGLDETHVQRCRNVWWTVYILDRQMSSLMGVPLAVRDEDITASLPTFSGSVQKTFALELNVKLSRIISLILNSKFQPVHFTPGPLFFCSIELESPVPSCVNIVYAPAVYGAEGRLNRKFIKNTKDALKGTASVTDQLKQSFDLPVPGSTGGISRLAAHLHLLHHQVSSISVLVQSTAIRN